MGEGNCASRNQTAPSGGVYRPRNPRASPLWQCARRHARELREAGQIRRALERRVSERFIECGDPHHGFARIYCHACGHDYLLAYSCKMRNFCPSCHQKRVLLYGEWVEENVLELVVHRQCVFTVPRLLRPIFGRHRAWLGELRRIAARLLVEAYAEAAPAARPGLILFVQTFGDLANFNPHVHVLAADGAFGPEGTFVPLPAIPEGLLVEGFRRAVLGFLVAKGSVSEDLRCKLLGWRHSGFSVHNQVRVGKSDAEGRRKLAGYMLRAPMSVEKMSYDAATGTVIYRSKMHLVRYVGWYSNRARGERASAQGAGPGDPAHGSRSGGGRVRHPCQGGVGAAHPQGLRSRSARMSQMQRPDARDRADR